MPLWIVRGFLIVAVTGAAVQSSPTSIAQPVGPNIAGVWVFNPALSVRPDEIGFTPDWARTAGPGGETGRSGGGRSRRGGSSSGSGAEKAPVGSPDSADDSTRLQQLTAEARTPPAHLTIVQGASSVSIADDQGLARTFHPDGKLADLTIGSVVLPTTALWDSGSLVVLYEVASGRQLRYTYTASENPKRLLVDIRFIERKREGDEVRLMYEPPDAHNDAVLSGAAAPPASPGLPGTTRAPETGCAAPPEAATPSARPPALPPGSELRGLTTIGADVGELGPQAAACGLDEAKIKASISHILTDAGFKTPIGKEDADVVVSIATSKLPDGLCVSRYDASVVSYADATFPYLRGTVAALEVQLLHNGGMTGGSPSAHATAVMDALTKAVTQFVAQIRAANK